MSDRLPLSRRTVLTAGALGAVSAALPAVAASAGTTPPATPSGRPGPKARELRFRPDGTFKVVQFNDTQDDELTDRRTVELIEKVLDQEKPDFVVINGDVISGGCASRLEVKQAINNVVWPMESRRIPWAVTYGNHDEDSLPESGVDEAGMLKIYRSYDYNVNADNAAGLTGTSNTIVSIASSAKKNRDAFALWLIDSGRYAPGAINGQNFDGYPTWDWIRMDQVAWYREQSQQLEKRLGRKVPGLMFIHIALWEHRFMWWGGVDTRTAADAARGRARHGIIGERNEDECPGPINSGMYNAILERGDVKGVFVGHDHVNDYVGDYYGVMLGYAPGTGFGAYGLDGAERNRLRGGRVFELTENGDDVSIQTRVVYARDLGIDLTANDQPMEPLPLAPKQERI
ncbi:metallophosphoesterase family protein [Microbacterium arabinogalactanolyticum]|uniref:Phosphoesterase n=1 Tax=Microbacterium arabinogalactanolyticum TaxID=69365 RepID=A0ABQ5NDA2_9MICO|nr:metallophosphoesterase family protein [Microbacterium arabinogalactanolyticum]GLC83780.1 phosphoesterase [Microbacterium arabinogalactanolyticum]